MIVWCRHTTLWRAEVFAGSWSPGAGTPSLLDAQSSAFVDLTLQSVLGGVCALRGHHLDESEAAALAGVWITHNVALLHVAVLLEELADLLLVETRVDAGDEQIRSRVDGLVVVAAAGWGSVTV